MKIYKKNNHDLQANTYMVVQRKHKKSTLDHLGPT